MGAAVTVQRGHGTFLASLHLLVTRKVSFAFTVYPPPPLLSSDPTHTHPPFLFLPYSHRKACVTRAIPPQCCMRQFQLNRRAAKEFPGNKVMKSENKNSKKEKEKKSRKKERRRGGGARKLHPLWVAWEGPTLWAEGTPAPQKTQYTVLLMDGCWAVSAGPLIDWFAG